MPFRVLSPKEKLERGETLCLMCYRPFQSWDKRGCRFCVKCRPKVDRISREHGSCEVSLCGDGRVNRRGPAL